MVKKLYSDSVVVSDRSSRRKFMRSGAGFLLAGAAVTATGNAQADCDGGGNGERSNADQDSGENADPKGCQNNNIVSEHQPERTSKVKLTRIKV